jgi:hypothetical protein
LIYISALESVNIKTRVILNFIMATTILAHRDDCLFLFLSYEKGGGGYVNIKNSKNKYLYKYYNLKIHDKTYL